MTIKRRVARWQPEWTGVYENYARAFVRKHHWRVRNIIATQDDYMQECAMVFAYCKDKYVTNPDPSAKYGRVDTPQWFMSIYQRALLTHRTRAQERDIHYRDVVDTTASTMRESSDGNAVDIRDNTADPASNEGVMVAALKQASAEVLDVIAVLASAPEETIKMLLDGVDKGAVFQWRHRRIINARLRKLCGLPKGIDFIKQLSDLVT
jgi:hypothetical protein